MFLLSQTDTVLPDVKAPEPSSSSTAAKRKETGSAMRRAPMVSFIVTGRKEAIVQKFSNISLVSNISPPSYCLSFFLFLSAFSQALNIFSRIKEYKANISGLVPDKVQNYIY